MAPKKTAYENSLEKKPISLKEKEAKKSGAWYEEYVDPLSGHSFAMTDLGLERMSSDLVKWANTKDAFTLTQFYLPKGIPPKTWQRWIQKSECLKDAQDMAKELIAIRREVGVASGKMRSDMIKPVHGYYSGVWREEQDRVAKMGDISGGTKVVVMETMPNSDVVPVLKG
jgi:hypothetical protein